MEAVVVDAGSKFLKAGFAIPDQTPAMVLFFTFLNCKTGTPPKKKGPNLEFSCCITSICVKVWSFVMVILYL